MKLNFDFSGVKIVQFGVGLEDGDDQIFRCVVVDSDIQTALREMATATRKAMQELINKPPKYEPSEKYASLEYVHLPLDDDLAQRMRELYEAHNLPIDSQALSDPSRVFCYFARMTDKQGRRLTALRRATQFKGVLKSRLIRLVTDALKLVEDKVFKLDADFDLLIDSQRVHILRPSGFEFVGKLQYAVLAAVPKNIRAIEKDLKFVDFSSIQEYASEHSRAARYLASIRTQDMKNIEKSALKKMCEATGVEIQQAKGKIIVPESSIMDFLEVLDRRRYEVELVKGSPERYRAGSRRRLENV